MLKTCHVKCKLSVSVNLPVTLNISTATNLNREYSSNSTFPSNGAQSLTLAINEHNECSSSRSSFQYQQPSEAEYPPQEAQPTYASSASFCAPNETNSCSNLSVLTTFPPHLPSCEETFNGNVKAGKTRASPIQSVFHQGLYQYPHYQNIL